MNIFNFFKKKKQTRDEIIQQMRQEERKEYKEKMHFVRTSPLTTEEKKAQRDALRKEHIHLLTIYK